MEQRDRGVADRAMRSYLVIVSTPTLKLFAGIGQRQEPVRGRASGEARPVRLSCHNPTTPPPGAATRSHAERSAAAEGFDALYIIDETTFSDAPVNEVHDASAARAIASSCRA